MYCPLTDGSAYGWILPLLCLAMVTLCILFATRGVGCCPTPPWRRKKAPRHPPYRARDSGE